MSGSSLFLTSLPPPLASSNLAPTALAPYCSWKVLSMCPLQGLFLAVLLPEIFLQMPIQLPSCCTQISSQKTVLQMRTCLPFPTKYRPPCHSLSPNPGLLCLWTLIAPWRHPSTHLFDLFFSIECKLQEAWDLAFEQLYHWRLEWWHSKNIC